MYVLPTPCRLGCLPAQQGSQTTARGCCFLKSCLPGVPLCSATPVWDNAPQICLFTLPYRDLSWDSKARKWVLDPWSSIPIARTPWGWGTLVTVCLLGTDREQNKTRTKTQINISINYPAAAVKSPCLPREAQDGSPALGEGCNQPVSSLWHGGGVLATAGSGPCLQGGERILPWEEMLYSEVLK